MRFKSAIITTLTAITSFGVISFNNLGAYASDPCTQTPQQQNNLPNYCYPGGRPPSGGEGGSQKGTQPAPTTTRLIGQRVVVDGSGQRLLEKTFQDSNGRVYTRYSQY